MLRRLPLIYLASNLISLIGVVLVTTAGILWLLLLPSLWRGDTANPYLGIPLFMFLPALFIAGLALIPIGISFERRKRNKAGETGPFLPHGNELRRLAMFIGITTFLNLVIGGQLTYSAVNYMDSDAFCGTTCHKVMQPEYTAYLQSPHARVSCADCHIGPGASWFVKSKISGVGQLVAVAFHTYPTPIPDPVESLRPARETCEKCHWPQRFSGDVFTVRTSYGSDEQNTPATTVALMKVGGRTFRGTVGIHGAHVAANAKMSYIATDGHRQVIPQVTYTSEDGKTTVYKSTDVKITPADLERGEHRNMDCMDCHNRPTHIFQLPDRAVDQAITQGSINASLPFIKKAAVEALKHEYRDRDAANREIAVNLENFYRTKYPQVYNTQRGQLQTAITAVQGIYQHNIFPEMKVTWGTYPNNLGHTDAPGCFRCHDGNHVSAEGRTISNDCATCHDLLAMEEKNPKILSDLGLNKPLVSAAGATK
jgi:hypothetical protein